MGVSNVPAASAAGLQPKYQKFTSSGTFTLPTGYGVSKPLLINIQVIGGGGGGSAYQANLAGNANTFYATWYDYFGNQSRYALTYNGSFTGTVNYGSGSGGGSGGLASSQMYLTSNLTITVGAAGSRPTVDTINLGDKTWRMDSNLAGAANLNRTNTNAWLSMGGNNQETNYGATGGTGGTSTAGVLSATGGAGASARGFTGGTATVTYNINVIGDGSANTGTANAVNVNLTNSNWNNVAKGSAGSAGQPAGSAGEATPLLGALAGGSSNTTPVYGAFGVGGKSSDGATATGTEGSGGGWGSIGASGAVIITWWE